MRISRLLDTKIYKQEYISPAELRAYFRSNPEEFSSPTVHVFRQILIPHDDPDVDEILRAIQKDRTDGRDFAEMVEEYSRGPRAEEGGLYELTDESLSAWWPPVPDRVRALPIGAMSEPLRAASRIHIIEIVDHRVGRRKEFSECQAEIRSKLREQREMLQRERFEKELRRTAEIRRFIPSP